MHECALARAVVDAALRAAERAGLSRITRMVVRLGELQRIETDSFEFALKAVMPGAERRLAGAVIPLEREPAQFRCRPCAHAFCLADTRAPGGDGETEAIHFLPELAHAFLRCPRCLSPDFEVVAGRGVSIACLEGEP